ncbi:MAG: DUF4149 domain-containing protein [Mariprofundales bacterium]|nr:DUF4149 domain-containing protein [Mariprofundales bacterium]
MIKLQLAATRLCTALILGLLVVSGFVAAPVLFFYAGDRMLAGMLAGHIFHIANLGVILLAVASAGFWFQLRARGFAVQRLHWCLLAIIALSIAINAWGISPQMEIIKAAATQGIDALAANNPLRTRFGMLHGISELLHLLAAVASTWLVAIGLERTAP